MSATETRLALIHAQSLSAALIRELAPACVRICVAGSIRRRQPTIGDIEIVAIPAERPRLLIGRPATPLDEVLIGLEGAGRLERLHWGPKGRRFFVPDGPCNLDLHLCTPETWACCLLIRTGPAAFGHRLVTPRRLGGWMPDRLRMQDLRLVSQIPGALAGVPLATPEEEDVFGVLGIDYLQPWER